MAEERPRPRRDGGLGVRLHAALARLLPGAFRRRYRGEIGRLLEARRREVASAGVGARLRFWAVELLDLLRTLLREWRNVLVEATRAASPAQSATPAPSPPRTPRHRPPSTTRSLSLPERTRQMLTHTWRDLRFAARTLAQRPLFAALIMLTVGLGIGGTTAVYTLVDSVLLRPLPFEEPGRLYMGFGSFPQSDSASVSPPDFLDYRERSDSFEHLAALTSFTQGVTLGGGGSPEQIASRRVTHDLFEALGVEPVRGRGFTPDETREGGPRVALIGSGLWQRRFGGDPSVVGRRVLLDEEAATVVGVVPDAPLRSFGNVGVWRPLRFGEESMAVRRFHFLRVVGRLHDDVEIAAARAELDAIAADLEAAYPESNTGWTLRMVPLHEAMVGNVREPLIFLLMAVGAVLLIASGNVAVLLLSRATRRSPEIAVRRALGAGSGRIVRMLLCESLLLAAAGGALGLLVADRAVGVLATMAGSGLPRTEEIGIDGSVLLFSAVVTVGTGLLFGLVPALRSGRQDLAAALRSRGRAAAAGNVRLRKALVVGQVALSFALLVSAGLMMRSLLELQRVEPGFEPRGLITASVELPTIRYEEEAGRRQFFESLFERLAATSAVQGAAGVDIAPLIGGNDTWAYPEGEPPDTGSQGSNAQLRVASPGYFDVMGIPLLRGRGFASTDTDGGTPVVVIDAPFAEQLFPETGAEGAVGRRIVVDLGESVVAEIVGVVGGVTHFGPALGRFDTMYFSLSQAEASSLDVVLRTDGPTAPAVDALRATVADLDPQIPVATVRTFDELLESSTAQPRFRALLVGLFAATALILAAAGIYGVLTYFVEERRQEMGVRLALGADGRRVVTLVVGRGMVLVAAGMALGLLLAAGAGWLAESMLFGVSATDPVSWAGVAALLTGVALVAGGIPAVRATRIDPIEVLRFD